MDSSYLIFIILFGVLIIAVTIQTYKKFGLKRVLLGKRNDNRELIYRTNGKIDWKPTLKSWKIIVTGGMDTLTVFLIILLLLLSYMYIRDINTTKMNDEKLCRAFGRVLNVTEEDIVRYNENNGVNWDSNNSNPWWNYTFSEIEVEGNESR
jgi:hypothetical protein